MSTRAEEVKQAAGGSGSEKRGNPNLNEKRNGKTDVTGAAADTPLEQCKFNPRSDASRNREASDAPTRLYAKETRKRQGAKVAKNRGENDADDGETERSTGVP